MKGSHFFLRKFKSGRTKARRGKKLEGRLDLEKGFSETPVHKLHIR